jgi:antitoxin CptB
MKELDLVLTRYLEKQYSSASEPERHAFQRLLEMQDPEIYALLLGRRQSDDPDIELLLTRITAIQ